MPAAFSPSTRADGVRSYKARSAATASSSISSAHARPDGRGVRMQHDRGRQDERDAEDP